MRPTFIDKKPHIKKDMQQLFFFITVTAFLLLPVYYMDAVKVKLKYTYRNFRKADLSNLIPLEDEKDAWYTRYNIIAHSGGAIDGKTGSNSLEALENSYQRGIRIIDADLNYTSDRILVLRHEWKDDMGGGKNRTVPTFQEFIGTKIFGRFTPMSLRDLFFYMDKYKDVYIACDVKELEDIETAYKEIVAEAKKAGLEEVLDRIIVSFYEYEDFFNIKSIYPFKNWVIRQYINAPHNYSEMVRFCVENNIHVCNIGTYYLDEGDDISILKKYNIHVFAAVVDENDMFDKLQKNYGIDGVISNYICEKQEKSYENHSIRNRLCRPFQRRSFGAA